MRPDSTWDIYLKPSCSIAAPNVYSAAIYESTRISLSAVFAEWLSVPGSRGDILVLRAEVIAVEEQVNVIGAAFLTGLIETGNCYRFVARLEVLDPILLCGIYPDFEQLLSTDSARAERVRRNNTGTFIQYQVGCSDLDALIATKVRFRQAFSPLVARECAAPDHLVHIPESTRERAAHEKIFRHVAAGS